jgi:hypothetical protein
MKRFESTLRRLLHPDLIRKNKTVTKIRSHISRNWQQIFQKRLLPLGGVSEGNKISIFHSGDPAFTAMWDSISKVIRCS